MRSGAVAFVSTQPLPLLARHPTTRARLLAGKAVEPSLGTIFRCPVVFGASSMEPGGRPFDLRMSATRSAAIDGDSEPSAPLGMLVRTNVSRSPTVFCEYPSQNGVPTSWPSPVPPSVWHSAQLPLKVLMARTACASVNAPSHTVPGPAPAAGACAVRSAAPRLALKMAEARARPNIERGIRRF